MKEMTQAQRKALDLWLDAATLYNDFKPLTDREVAAALAEAGMEGSKSAVARWRTEFKWQAYLENKIAASVVDDEETREKIAAGASASTVRKTIVDVERNSKLTSDAYEVLELKLTLIIEKFNKTQQISLEDAKLAKEIAAMTSGREDKLLDRAALMGAAEKVSRTDFMDAIADTVIDIED